MKPLDAWLMDLLEDTVKYKIPTKETKNLIIAKFNTEHNKIRVTVINDLIDTLKELK